MNFLSSIFNFYFLQEIFFDSSFCKKKWRKIKVYYSQFFSLSLSIILDNSVSQKKR